MLSFDDILASEDCPEIEIEVPEWHGTVKVRGLRRAELNEAKKCATVQTVLPGNRVSSEVSDELFEAEMLHIALVDPPLEREQAMQLVKGKGAMAVGRLIKAIFTASGIGEDVIREAEQRFPERS